MPNAIFDIKAGEFVVSSANDHGIGRLRSSSGNEAVIEYFDTPEDSSIVEETVPVTSLQRTQLETHSRVYIKDENTGAWTVGTLVWHLRSEALVIFPDGSERQVRDSLLHVRWKHRLQDPSALLANRIAERAQFAFARRHFLAHMSKQKLAAGGMPCLLSSAVDLEHHQIEVVRRVLRDPVQRYLLGDEVGLGKTIEAGFLIRQHVYDHPATHHVLVIVPKALKQQWKRELGDRFGLATELHSTVKVTELKKLADLPPDFQPSMIVIDEAHQVASLYRGNPLEMLQFEAIRKLALVAPRLLLLTATPLLHNERDYLTMLHLLDPEIYQLDDIDGFRSRVSQRQAIAEACFVLRADTTNGFLRDVVQQIADQLSADRVVKELSATLIARLDVEADESDPQRNEAIHTLRTHLNEVYKLHRRLLRNRRVGELKAVTPGRAGINRIFYTDPKLVALFEALEDWRESAVSESRSRSPKGSPEILSAEFGQLLARCLELGYGLVEYTELRQATSAEDVSPLPAPVCFRVLFEGERDLLETIGSCAAAVLQSDARMNALVDHIAQNVESSTRWVIFCSSPSLADKLSGHFKARFETTSVLRHSLDNPEWRRFYSNDEVAILVCDHRAEEGLNLQGRDAVLVHFDLPFSPERIEQRMGRLDRFSCGRPVRSILLCADGNAWEDSWMAFMNEGLGVFSDSIASLQYSTSDWIAQGTNKSFTLGSEAWEDLAGQLAGPSGEVAKQKRLIAEQDAMDLMDLSDDTSEALVSRLHALETPAFLKAFSETLADWAEKALSIKIFEEEKHYPGVIRLVVSEDRTLIPQRQVETYFAGALDAAYKPAPWAKDARAASRKMSFGRRLAQERRCLVARYGEKFLDALYDYTRKDDRGRCYAVWRGRRSLPERCEGVYLRFDFVIEAEDSQALSACGAAVDPRAIRREADAVLSPLHLEIWLDADHEIVSDAGILALLNAPLVSSPGPFQDGDFDLNHRRWATAAQHDGFRDWQVRLRRSVHVAREKVDSLHKVRGHIAEAKKAAEHWLRNFECQIASRLTVLPDVVRDAETRQLDIELAWRRAIINSLDKPRFLLDSAGVVVLDRRSFQN